MAAAKRAAADAISDGLPIRVEDVLKHASASDTCYGADMLRLTIYCNSNQLIDCRRLIEFLIDCRRLMKFLERGNIL